MLTITAPALEHLDSTPIEVTLNNMKYALVDWSSYEKMARAQRNAEYLAKLDRGFEQMRKGQGQVHDLIEVDDE